MTGWRLLLTRPADESAALAAQLGAAGIYTSSLPLLEIKPLPVSAPMRTTLHELASFAAVIAVSKPAARLGLALIAEMWPQPPAQAWFSVGDSTGQVLEHSLGQHGLRVRSPAASGDSESLLALPALREAAMQPGARILILRGEGGRGTLGEGLQALGASVTYLELYSRHAPQYPQGALLERVAAERLNALMVSSGQGFQHLLQQLGGAWSQLANMPLFVPSSRVAALARAAGAMNVVDCRGATAAALLAALRENPAPPL